MKSCQDENTNRGLRIRIVPLQNWVPTEFQHTVVNIKVIERPEQVSTIQTRKLFPHLLSTRSKSAQTVTLICFFYVSECLNYYLIYLLSGFR